jgi:hypothetical protein
MFPRVGDVVRAIDDLKSRGIIRDYAIGGAFALSLWDEVGATFDIDVLVLIPGQGGLLVDLSPFYEWAAERGYEAEAEHIKISGIYVQLMPAPDALAEEAVQNADTLEVAGLPTKVITPPYLSALWLQPPANSATRKARISQMREAGVLDEAALNDLMARYNLSW